MNWDQQESPQPKWDTPGLPPRRMSERCARHPNCAYRDDDPNRCHVCHRKTPPPCNHAYLAPNASQTQHPGLEMGITGRASGGVHDRTRGVPTGYSQCGKCGEEWTGLAVAHCQTCHRTFTTTSAFDKHRIGSHTDPNDPRRCTDPLAVGLVPTTRANWSGYGWPGDDHRFAEVE